MNPTAGIVVIVQTDENGKSYWLGDDLLAKLNTRHYLNKSINKSCKQLAIFDGVDSYIVFNEYLEPYTKTFEAISDVQNTETQNIYKKYQLDVDVAGKVCDLRYVEQSESPYTKEFEFLSVQIYSIHKLEIVFRMKRLKNQFGFCVYSAEEYPDYKLYLEPQFPDFDFLQKGKLWTPFASTKTEDTNWLLEGYQVLYLRTYWRYHGLYWWIPDKYYYTHLWYKKVNPTIPFDYKKRFLGLWDLGNFGGYYIEHSELENRQYNMPYDLDSSYLIVNGIGESTCPNA